jgi:hypothetical protein
LIILRERLLHRDGALDRIDSAGELGQNAVTGCIGDAPAVLGNEAIHNRAMSGQGAHSPDLILLHEARVACHISREDGCQPPFDLVLLPIHGTLGAVPDQILLRAG